MSEKKTIERNAYLKKLIAKRDNGAVKVITGVRRCGKSYLLFTLYRRYLLESGVADEQIVSLALDNILSAKYRDPMVLAEYLDAKTPTNGCRYYVLLDEIQYVGEKKLQDNPEIRISFYDVLNSLLQKGNTDIYVTGSNSKMLSSDIATEFRGRGDELHISPLSFSEFYSYRQGDRSDAFSEYLTYGGLPAAVLYDDIADKKKYLSDLFSETYLKDILERHRIAYPESLALIADELCSAVGSLTNAGKIADTLMTVRQTKLDSETVGAYLGYLTDAYLFERSDRYDVKGRRYFSYPSKYYCVDTGLRNARLNFRQLEETHLMENVIYSELKRRGHSVDVGVVETVDGTGDNRKRRTYEIDFVVNAEKFGEKCYIQSALNLDTPEKTEQELRPFLRIPKDFTRRILITRSNMPAWTDEYGILHLSIYDFLLGETI